MLNINKNVLLLKDLRIFNSMTNRCIFFHKKSFNNFEEEEEIATFVENKNDHKIKNLITVPLKLEERLKEKFIFEQSKKYEKIQFKYNASKGNRTRLVIECKRKDFNHYQGQSYQRGADIPLASKGWMHRKSYGDHFILRQRNSVGFEKPDKNVSFRDLEVKENICNLLYNDGIKHPSTIQSLVIPPLLERKNALFTSETGSGKTLSFLVPMFQHLMADKLSRIKRNENQPLIVILGPTRELTEQIYKVAKRYEESLNIKINYLSGGNVGAKIVNARKNPDFVDIVVSTLGIMNTFLRKEIYDVSRVEHIIIDEADTYFDDSFSKDLITCLNHFNFSGEKKVQTILSSATVPNDVEEVLSDILPIHNFLRITTPGIHSLMPHVLQSFLRVKKSEKHEKLLEIVKRELDTGNIGNGIMVFCNKNATCNWIDYYLKENGIDSVTLNSHQEIKNRNNQFELYQSNLINVICCTDLGSRGLDTIKTRHIVNYEFPSFISDYIHRCGRTGRLGSVQNCEITNLISSRAEVPLVNEIEMTIRKESKLKDVDANVKKLLNSKYGLYDTIDPDAL